MESAETLAQVREKFLQADSALRQLAESLTKARRLEEQFAEAVRSVRDAGTELGRTRASHEAAARSLEAVTGALREGVQVLQRSEPEQLRRELAEVGKNLDATRTELRTLEESVRALCADMKVAGRRAHRMVMAVVVLLLLSLGTSVALLLR